MAAASASASGQVAGPGQAAGPPLVTLASSNFLMPPPANHSQSSHSSNEDIGCSNEVRLKLHVRQFFWVFFIKSSPWTVNDVPKEWYFLFCYQNCSNLLWEKNVLLIEKNFGLEFAKFLRSLEQFFQTVKGQDNFWLNRMPSWLVLWGKLEQL